MIETKLKLLLRECGLENLEGTANPGHHEKD